MNKNNFSTPGVSNPPGSGSGPTRHNPVQKELAHAEDLRKINQLDQALLVLKRCLTLAPEAGEVYLARAEVYRQGGSFEAALADLDQAAALLPGSAQVYIQRGLILRLLKKFQDSLHNFNLAIGIKPDDVSALGHRGTLYRSIREYEKSLADYNTALTLDPANPWLLGNRAETYRGQQEYRKALDDYNKVLQLNPALGWVYERRSYPELYLGELDQARADFDRAWRENPTNLMNGWMAEWTGMCNKDFFFNPAVEEKLTEIARYAPDHYAAYLCRASLFWLLGYFKKSYSEAQTACENQPDKPDAFFWRSMAAAGLGENEEALHLLQKAADLGLSPVLVKPLTWLKRSNPDFYHLRAIGYLLEEGDSKTAPGPAKQYPFGEGRIEVKVPSPGQAQPHQQAAPYPSTLTTSLPVPPVLPIPSETVQGGVYQPVQNLPQVELPVQTVGSQANVNPGIEATPGNKIEQPAVSKVENNQQQSTTVQPRPESDTWAGNKLPPGEQTLRMRRIEINPQKPELDDSDFEIDEDTQRIPFIQRDQLKPAPEMPGPKTTLGDPEGADTTDFSSEEETIKFQMGPLAAVLARGNPPAVNPEPARSPQPSPPVRLEKAGLEEEIFHKAVPPAPVRPENLIIGSINPFPANPSTVGLRQPQPPAVPDLNRPAPAQGPAHSDHPVVRTGFRPAQDAAFPPRPDPIKIETVRKGQHVLELPPQKQANPVRPGVQGKRSFILLLGILAGLLLLLGTGYFLIALFLNRPTSTGALSTNGPAATASLDTAVPVPTLTERAALDPSPVIVTNSPAATTAVQSTKIATSPAATQTPPVATMPATTVVASSATVAPTTSTWVVTATLPPPTVESTSTAIPVVTVGGDTSTVNPVTPVPGRVLFSAFSNRGIEGLTGPVTAASWSRDGLYLATGAEDKSLKIWEVSSGKLVTNLTPAKDVGVPLALAWSSDGNFLVTGWSDNNVRVFRVFPTGPGGTSPAGQIVAEITDNIAPEALAIAPGTSLITYPGKDTLHTLDYSENSRGPEFKLGGIVRILAVNFSPDNRYLAAGLNDGRVLVWEKATLKLLLVIQPAQKTGPNPVSRLIWTSDGKSLVVGSQKSLAVYRVSLTGGAKVTEISISRESTSPVTALSLSADNKLLAVGYGSGKIELWSVEQEKLLSQVTAGTDPVTSLTISSDSHQLMVLKGGNRPQLSSYFIQAG